MSGDVWAVRLSPQAAKTLTEHPEHARETVRDVLDIVVRSPWDWPQWNNGDREGEDVRAASVGQMPVVYVINRLVRHLSVLDIVWLGSPPVTLSKTKSSVPPAAREARTPDGGACRLSSQSSVSARVPGVAQRRCSG
ncbi:hypothetical protein [Streptomyces sp. NPDC001787]|uniref:hypothetical protein n=1 Tax=Streptomyces sp. NPDC001787 TaxID=3154523 RepID=UPI0033173946